MKLVAISAGLSDGSAATRLAQGIAESAGGELEVVALRSYARDIADALTRGFPGEKLEEIFAKVKQADAVVAVSPVYNALPSGLFISFFDVLPEGVLAGKPVALGATGGTPRHSLVIEQAIRPMFVYLHAVVPTTAVYAATEDWGALGEGFDGLAGQTFASRVGREGRELRALVAMVKRDPALLEVEQEAGQNSRWEPAEELGKGQEAGQPVKPGGFRHGAMSADEAAAIEQFPDFVSFEDLLK
ncbi:CE1759 family FMN reductase [Actinomycetaceae bacterium L2_0104]